MTGQKPFLFDRRSFDADLVKVSPEEQPRYSQQSFDQAIEAAEARGRGNGIEQAREFTEQKIVDQLAQLNNHMQLFLQEQQARDTAAQELAVEVALGLVRKLVPELLSQPALEGITNFLRQVLADHYEENKLIIRVHESMLDALHQKIQNLPELIRVQDKYALIGDPHLALSDCRIEWPSGGIERHNGRLWQQLEAVTAQLVAQLKSASIQASENLVTIDTGVGNGG